MHTFAHPFAHLHAYIHICLTSCNIDSLKGKKQEGIEEMPSPRTMSAYDASVAAAGLEFEDEAEEFFTEEELHELRAADTTKREEAVPSWSDEVKLAQLERQVRIAYLWARLRSHLGHQYALTDVYLPCCYLLSPKDIFRQHCRNILHRK